MADNQQKEEINEDVAVDETTELEEVAAEATAEAPADISEGEVETVEETTEVEASEENQPSAETEEQPVDSLLEQSVDGAELAEKAAAVEATDQPEMMSETATNIVAESVVEEAGVDIASVGIEIPIESTEESAREGVVKAFRGEISDNVVRFDDIVEEVEEEEELDPELLDLYEASMTMVEENEIVTGRVVTLGDKDVVIDIGFKSDGIVARNEFDEEVNPGDEVAVYLERIEDRNGQLVLSKRRADELSRWQAIENAHNNDTVVEGEIVNRIKGGMIVNLFGSEAFLPGSQIDIRPVRDFDAYLGKRMEFKVVKINPMNGNVVVSHKALIEKDLEAQREEILSTMEAGQVLEGTVKNITDFGVFIDLGGVDGLLHITDLSWGRVGHPSEVVDLDEKLKVVVLDYDKERQRISLGLKQLTPHPWDNISERFVEDSVIKGRVVSITDYGAFVELEKGIEGLVHISEMSWTQHIKHPTEVVSIGDEIDVKVLNIDEEGRKISLGIKQLSPDPWQNLSERFPAGSIVKGTVRNLTNFGVFVEIDQGIDGLVHISDLSWTKKIRHPGEVVRKGQELDVVILSIDEENRRLSLGHKQIETNPWKQFAVAYSEGTDTEGRIVRFLDNGLIVQLPLEVEAFVPGSHLVRNADDLSQVYETDEMLELRVIEFNLDEKKIVLSERAKKAAEEKREKQTADRARKRTSDKDQREYSSYKRSPSGGAATLGELSGLENLKQQMEAAEAEAAETEVEVEAAAVKNSGTEAVVPDEADVPSESEEVEVAPAEDAAPDEAEVTPAEDAAPEEKPKRSKKKAKPKKASEKAGDSSEEASDETSSES